MERMEWGRSWIAGKVRTLRARPKSLNFVLNVIGNGLPWWSRG